MNIIEDIISAIGEIVAYLLGQIVRYTFHLEPKKAQLIGEYMVLLLIVIAAVLVTVIYS